MLPLDIKKYRNTNALGNTQVTAMFSFERIVITFEKNVNNLQFISVLKYK